MRMQLVCNAILSLTAGLLLGSCAVDSPGREDVPEAVQADALGATTAQVRMIAFVAYFDDAAHTNLIGSATFSQCPGDPSGRWGSTSEFYTIESEPCAGGGGGSAGD